jgi:hypothetical protein
MILLRFYIPIGSTTIIHNNTLASSTTVVMSVSFETIVFKTMGVVPLDSGEKNIIQ